MKDTIYRQDTIAVFGDIHPMDYNAQAYVNAIKALPSAQPDPRFYVYEDMSDIEILSDLRSRYNCFDGHEEPVYHALSEAIKALTQPERTGKWIGTEFDGYADGSPVYYEWKCSACGVVFEDEEPTYKYCPNCGAKMEE